MNPVRTIFTHALKCAFICLVCLWAGALSAQPRLVDADLIAHEWGTFTSVAGGDGEAVVWVPLTYSDLVFDENPGSKSGKNHYRSRELPGFVETLDWGVFKGGLHAVIRMETPVLYFYSRHEVTVSVEVKFAKGLITEWYPQADAPRRHGAVEQASLYRDGAADGSIAWKAVVVAPGSKAVFPRDLADSNNRYYAARETLSSPLVVHTSTGDQHERFLFYRGVSLSPVPVSAKFAPDGGLLVRNWFDEGISNAIWFERRGNRVGYRIGQELEREALLEPPQLTATLEQLYGDLEEILVSRGLYREEAHAMVQTWHDSWFEEGSRLFYIVPNSFVNAVLPLTVSPAPAETVRVFVGRLELISPATQKAVATALASNDKATLAKYARFMDPIRTMIKADKLSSETRAPESSQQPCRVDETPGAATALQKRRR